MPTRTEMDGSPDLLEIYHGSNLYRGTTGRHPYHLAQVGDVIEGRRVLAREWHEEEDGARFVTLRLILAFAVDLEGGDS